MLAPHSFGGLVRGLVLATTVVIAPAIVAQPPTTPPQPSDSTTQEPKPQNGPDKQQLQPGADGNQRQQQGQMPQERAPQSQMGAMQPDQPMDPKAMAALNRMGQYLASLKMLMFNADIFTEVVLENQQKLLIGGTVKYMAMPPKQLRVDLTTDSITRQFFHNGNKFTMLAPRNGYFAEMQAPEPTAQVLSKAAKDYGIEVPFADLLEWGRKQDTWSGIKEGFLVNRPMINGQRTEHWAFRSESLDWEIWIKVGDTPLPLRISTVNTRDPAKPRFIATLNWTEAKPGAAGSFSPVIEKLKQIKFKKAEPNKGATQ
ncbi:DUF2092 domain-containing protein [Microbulbifer sp. OS29]|uniref:DUF2092 domain-containing protein n=1 Tax=Microbulbifer okhotskensis TaxID=2926617 RepID=A0A9X2ELC3_9GAMM|nr:DUF2092 domain-containing protein [Microbulbifer okhotskensis]MCO1334354.1 DUF2092 domain-containing protein [Microbulbifer okhotskensis]